LFQLRVSAPTKEIDSGSSARTWPTPTTKGFGHASEGQTLIMRDLVERGELTEEEAQAMMNGTTLRPPRMKEWMWPTPTAMDTKEDALKHATKLLQGKTHRSSGQPIQKTLSDKVMMDLIIKHPELMELYQDHQMEERPNLPPQQEFVDYLRLQTTIKDLSEKTNIKKTTIEHWFRKDDKGFSYPSIENWEQIKPHLKEIKYDKEMTTLESKEWTKKDQMFQTPTAMDHLPPRNEEALKKQYMKNRQGRSEHSTLREQVIYPKPQEMWPTPTTQETEHPSMKLNEKGRRVSPKGKESHSLNLADKVQMWPTPRARDYKDGSSVPPSRVKNPELATLGQKVVMEKQKFWPTPRASIGMNMSLSENMAKLRHKRYLETEMAYEIHKEKLWSTPSASLGKHSYNGNNEYYENRIEKGRQKDLAVEMYQKEGLGKLSPNFVEYLMGFPDGWTNPDISNEQLISMNTEQKD
jgi:hypothetical protein